MQAATSAHACWEADQCTLPPPNEGTLAFDLRLPLLRPGRRVQSWTYAAWQPWAVTTERHQGTPDSATEIVQPKLAGRARCAKRRAGIGPKTLGGYCASRPLALSNALHLGRKKVGPLTMLWPYVTDTTGRTEAKALLGTTPAMSQAEAPALCGGAARWHAAPSKRTVVSGVRMVAGTLGDWWLGYGCGQTT